MSEAVTIDEVETAYSEAAAATFRTKVQVKKNVTIWTITAGLWNVNRKLKQLITLLERIDFRPIRGLTCQSLESSIAKLIVALRETVEICKKKRLHNRTLTAGGVYSLEARGEELNDLWVALSSSTDASLDEAISSAKNEKSISWESLWR